MLLLLSCHGSDHVDIELQGENIGIEGGIVRAIE
jgi:hypothetical protein